MTGPVRAGALVPVRQRAGTSGQTHRTVHLAVLAAQTPPGAVSALCGALLAVDQVERVALGAGMPCAMCLIQRTATPQQVRPLTELPVGGPMPRHQRTSPGGYAALGWPVVVRGDHVLLAVDADVLALMMPIAVATRVLDVLTARSRPAPVLVHPHASEHRIVLAGEPFGVELPWPDEIHPAIGSLPLPPTVTPAGPVRWEHLPDSHLLSFCREIDVFDAWRTLDGTPGR